MSGEKIEILCVDDDPDDVEIFEEAASLTGMPVNVRHAMNDIQLFDYFKSSIVPNVIFLDGSVTCHCKNTCLEEIKAQKHLCDIPVVILSTIGIDNKVNDMYNRGAVLFLIKPASLSDLTSLLRTTLCINWTRDSIDNIKYNFGARYPEMKFPKLTSPA